MEKAEVLRLIDAHDWLWQQWWPALTGLSPDQARAEVGGSFPSLLATASHMVSAELTWQARCDGQHAAPPSAEEGIAALQPSWEALALRRQAWLEQHSPQTPVSYTHSGGHSTNSVEEIVLHLTSHAHFHRGQLATQFRLLGLKPPSVHFITFFRLPG